MVVPGLASQQHFLLKSPGFFSCHVTVCRMPKQGCLDSNIFHKIITWFIGWLLTILAIPTANHQRDAQSSPHICAMRAHIADAILLFFLQVLHPTTYDTTQHSSWQRTQGKEDWRASMRWLQIEDCRTAGTVSDTGSFKSYHIYPVNSVNFNETSFFYHLKPSFKESHIFMAQILTYPIW